MAPVKFDDLAKPTNEVLNDDYQTSGYKLKAKQGTNWDGAAVTTTLDLFGADAVKNTAQVSWKLPKPLGCTAIAIDKLEMDKSGKFKLETSLSKAMHKIDDLKIDVKSDLIDAGKVSTAATYTGVKDTQIKVEVKPLNASQFGLEVTRAVGAATVGIKCDQSNLSAPDVGVKFTQNSLAAALIATKQLSVYSAYACYKVDDVKLAASYSYSSNNYTAGVSYSGLKDATIKAKVDQDTNVSCSVKYNLAKGFSVLAGAKYGSKGSSLGLQVSIE